MFSQGQLLLSHMCSCLSIHSTCALLCIGKWSVLGLVKDSNVRSCLTGDKVGKDNSWPRSWARSQPRPAVGSQAKPVPKKSSQLPKAQASILASSTHWPWLRPLFWQAVWAVIHKCGGHSILTWTHCWCCLLDFSWSNHYISGSEEVSVS